MNSCKFQNNDIRSILRSSHEEFEIETTGNSMYPLFEEGSLLTIKFIEPQNIKIGDIIIFKGKNFLVTHRVIKKISSEGENYFIEKGDNNQSSSRIKFDDILGKVIYVRRKKTHTSNQISSKTSKQITPQRCGTVIKVDNFLARSLGLLLSYNDFIVKSLNSLIIHLKENTLSRMPIINLSLGPVIYFLRLYKFLIQKTGKILFFLMSEEIKE